MSFYTINTPGNREEEVKKYLQLKEYLRAKDSIDKTGHYERKKELLKTYKPLIKPLTEIKTKVGTLPQDIGKMTGEEFNKALAALPAPVAQFNIPEQLIRSEQLEQLEQPEQPEIKELSTGDRFADRLIAHRIQHNNYKEFFNFDPENTTFRIKNDPITINTKDGIKFKGKTYKYSSDLVDLLTTEQHVRKDINSEAVNDYINILVDAELLHQITKDGKMTTNQKLQKLPKWKDLNLKAVYDEIKAQKQAKPSTSGKGIKSTKNKTVFLSSNPDTLADRLTLLCASQKAGNTGVNNEIIDICNELIRMRVMTRQQKNKILKEYKP